MAGTGDKLMTASEIKEVTDTKLIKDFSSLTALSGTPATGDLVPIKSGNDTYKIDYNALASAILGQISSNGVVNVANGGTGSNSATGALSGLIGALDTSSGFSLSDTIPVSINGTAYTITGRTLSNAIGGGGTEQAALTNYVKNCGTITSLPATIEDENITEDMVLLAYELGTPTAMQSNWNVSTDDGEIEITGTISGSTTLTLTFGVGYSVAPTILTDLSSTTPDNILKASPRPGVTGTLPIANGGTGAASASAARTALDVYSKSEVTTAISQSTATETLHLGTFNTVDATTQLSHPVTDYYFVLLDFRTNSEHTWQLIPIALLPIGNNQSIHATIVGNNTSGQITYPPSFNSSINVQFVTASTIKCTQSLYNNSNFRISLFGVYGLYKK